MISSPLTLLGLTGGVASADAATGLQGLSGAAPATGAEGQFSDILGSTNNGLTLISTEATQATTNLLVQNLAGQNLPTQSIASAIGSNSTIQDETLKYLEQILSGKVVVEGQNLSSANTTNKIDANNLSDDQVQLLGKIQKFLEQNSDAITQATPEQIQGLMDTITSLVAAAQTTNSPVIPQVSSAAASSSEAANSANEVVNSLNNFGIKNPIKNITPENITAGKIEQNIAPQKTDLRVLGKDNMQAAVAANTAKDAQTVNDLLNDVKSIFDDKLTANNAIRADYDVLGSKVTGLDNIHRNIIDGKAAIANSNFIKTSSIDTPTYGIAKISKGANKIEITLEPAALGKVDVKFDFTSDGKTNLIVTAERKETLDLLQKDAKYFEKILSESGIKADSGSLSFNLRQQGSGAEGFAGQQQRNYSNQFNMAVPIVDESGNAINDNNYSMLSAYNSGLTSVSGLNILV